MTAFVIIYATVSRVGPPVIQDRSFSMWQITTYSLDRWVKSVFNLSKVCLYIAYRMHRHSNYGKALAQKLAQRQESYPYK